MYDGEQSNPDAQPPEESSNRTFLIAAGILGGIVLISLACLAGYYLLVVRGQGNGQTTANARATQNAQVAFALTSTSEAAIFPTATVTPPPTQTPVIAQATATNTVAAASSPDPATATVAAALTQAAQAQLTVVTTSTALPGTGFADEYGAPGLMVLGLTLIAVIFLARRLRIVPTG